MKEGGIRRVTKMGCSLVVQKFEHFADVICVWSLLPVNENALPAVARRPLVPRGGRRGGRGAADDGAARADAASTGLRCRGSRLLFVLCRLHDVQRNIQLTQ